MCFFSVFLSNVDYFVLINDDDDDDVLNNGGGGIEGRRPNFVPHLFSCLLLRSGC